MEMDVRDFGEELHRAHPLFNMIVHTDISSVGQLAFHPATQLPEMPLAQTFCEIQLDVQFWDNIADAGMGSKGLSKYLKSMRKCRTGREFPAARV
jgi:hypothetical protein